MLRPSQTCQRTQQIIYWHINIACSSKKRTLFTCQCLTNAFVLPPSYSVEMRTTQYNIAASRDRELSSYTHATTPGDTHYNAYSLLQIASRMECTRRMKSRHLPVLTNSDLLWMHDCSTNDSPPPPPPHPPPEYPRPTLLTCYCTTNSALRWLNCNVALKLAIVRKKIWDASSTTNQ